MHGGRSVLDEPAFLNEFLPLAFDAAHGDPKDIGNPGGFGTAAVAAVAARALVQHGAQEQPEQGGSPYELFAEAGDHDEAAPGKGDGFVACVRMELVEHGEGSLPDGVAHMELVDVVDKGDARVREAEQTSGFEFGEGLSLCPLVHAVEEAAHVFGLEGYGLVAIGLAWDGLAAPKFNLLRCKPDFEGTKTNDVFALSGPYDAHMHR